MEESPKDSRGTNFELFCATWVEPSFCFACFGFFRKDADAQRTLVGKCWFRGGINTSSIEYSSRDISPAGVPKCYLSSRWENVQPDENGLDAPLPNQPPGPLILGGRYPGDGKIDTWIYKHSVPNNKTDITVLKDLGQVYHQDPVSGPGFNDLPPFLGNLPEMDGIMILLPFDEALCDVNRDGECDGADLVSFRAGLGSCKGDANYNPFADANEDGCITPGDERVTFPVLPLSIDIKPGSFQSSINPNSLGTIPVAILSTPLFHVPIRVLTSSLTFGRTGNERSLAFCNPGGDDVNGDGLPDLVCHFNTKQTGFQPGDTLGILRGKTTDGIPIKGKGAVRIVP